MSKLEKKFLDLVNVWKNDECALEYIEKDMNSFANYVQAVYTMEMKITMASTLYNHDAEKYANIRYTLDLQRHNCHEIAITAINQLCRFARMKNVDPLYDGDLEDRYEIANFCRKIVLHFFDSGLSGTTVSHSFPHQGIHDLVHSAEHPEF